MQTYEAGTPLALEAQSLSQGFTTLHIGKAPFSMTQRQFDAIPSFWMAHEDCYTMRADKKGDAAVMLHKFICACSDRLGIELSTWDRNICENCVYLQNPRLLRPALGQKIKVQCSLGYHFMVRIGYTREQADWVTHELIDGSYDDITKQLEAIYGDKLTKRLNKRIISHPYGEKGYDMDF